VQWQGFDPLESTWEPFSNLQVDVPTLVKNVLANPPHPSFEELKSFLAAPA